MTTFNAANTFTGDLTVTSSTAFSSTSSWMFSIGANGVNNSIAGTGDLLLEGAFNLDLSGAGTSLGDSWSLVNTATLNETYAGTFNLTGFNDLGGNVWEQDLGGILYEYAGSTGLLSVTAIPEPSTLGLLMAAGAGILFRRRCKDLV